MIKPIGPDSLREAIGIFNRHMGESVVRINMSAYDYADIRKFGRDVFVLNSDASTLKQGYMGTFDDISIFVQRQIPKEMFEVSSEFKNIHFHFVDDTIHDGKLNECDVCFVITR